MKNVCKEYISDAKRFFPIMGKDERRYLRKMVGVIQDACDEKNITTKEQLYTEYAQPYQIANNYYESVKTETIIKKIKISKYIKIFISIIITIIIVFATFGITFWYTHHQMISREEIVIYDTVPKDDSNQKAKKYAIKEEEKSDNFDDIEEEIVEEEVID